MGQKSAAYNSTGAITAFYDSIDSPVPHGVTGIEITDAQWQACINTPGYTVANGALVAPVPPTAAQIAAQRVASAWSAYQASAQVALDKSDVTILRCYEHAIPVTADWIAYRAALRVIVSTATGDATAGLPTMPAYPAGS